MRTMLKEFFGGKDPNTEINPDEAVAIGVAIQAGILGEAICVGFLRSAFVTPPDVLTHFVGVSQVGRGRCRLQRRSFR